MQDNSKEAGSRSEVQGLPVVLRDAAGIDLGSERHWVCAPTPDGAGREVTSFGATTPELIQMAKWLQERNVRKHRCLPDRAP